MYISRLRHNPEIKMATAGNNGNAGKLEQAHKRNHTRMEAGGCVKHGQNQ